jgi:hypothetical protein
MKSEERGAPGFAPAANLVRLVHEHRGDSAALRRIDGARLLARRRSFVRGARSAWLIAAALLAVGAAAAVLVAHVVVRPLSFTVEGAGVTAGGVVESAPALEAKMHFSDGTEVSLAPGAKAVVRRVDAHGARVALAAGKAHVDVMHRPEARWLFDAGPFLIAVTGTAFTLGWAEMEQRLDVQMERGSVEVRGPLSDGPLAIRSGQHLIVLVRDRETIIRDLEASPAAGPATAPPRVPLQGASATGDPSVPVSPSPAPQGTGASPGSAPDALVTSEVTRDRPGLAPATDCKSSSSDWNALVARGEFGAIVQQTERRGVDRCLTTLGSGDLAALADAARYARRDELARRTLLTQRRRFSSTAAARDAAFLLGRLEETAQRPLSAIAWFDTYLGESPSGTYASDALGRKMVLVQRVRGDATARPLAAQYLARFPDGAYAATARWLTQAP